MSRLRNPFRMRASEKIVSDADFISMYSPSMLDILLNNESKLWEYVTYIRSSPGGGKTSLLRLFEPAVLGWLCSNKYLNKDLYDCLNKLNVFENDRVNTLGIYVLCSRSFEMLEDINPNITSQKRLFYSLLNSRVILATLRNLLLFTHKRFPEDLGLVQFNYEDHQRYFTNLKLPCSGKELYEWATQTEEKIFSVLDSLIPIEEESLPGHNDLFVFSVLSPENLYIPNEYRCKRFLFMLDDVHILTYRQRNAIRDEVIEKRGVYNLWIAERIETLGMDILTPDKNIKERDYQEISLEDFYRNKEARITALFSTLAEKRAALSLDNLTSFEAQLTTLIDKEKYREQYLSAIRDSQDFFERIKASTNKYEEWFVYLKNSNHIDLEEFAILCKEVEVLIYRDLKKEQLTLDFGFTVQELEVQLGGEIKSAALYFISMKYKIPYYYGFASLTKISSFNIEQFLSFSSELFERMLSNKLLNNSILLAPEDQEKILKDVAMNKWKALSTSIPFSDMIIIFLKKLGAFCREETEKPNAPYAPGVNGIAIKEEYGVLFKSTHWAENENLEPLLNVISTCVAFNLLEIKQVLQGTKGQRWNVFYLNRWLCIYFQLPLLYGNWRAKSPHELYKWIK